MRLRNLLTGVAIVGATIGGLSNAAIGHGKHHHSESPDFATQDACIFNAAQPAGADAEPLYWGACSDLQVSLGGVTVVLYVVPN